MDKKRIAVYPGTFDPVTNGHLDVLHRALRLFDEVVVGVACNAGKKPLLDFRTRRKLFEENVADMPNVRVEAFDGLTVDFVRKHGAIAIIRGLRAVSDFEFEFQMAQMNRHLDDEVETVILMPSHKYFYTSSTLIKQVAGYDVDRVSSFVPANVLAAFRERKSGV